MRKILLNQGRINNAKSIYSEIVAKRNYYHFTIGKTALWKNENEDFWTGPDIPIDCNYSINNYRSNIIFSSQIEYHNLCFLARRIDWLEDEVYDQYDDSYGRIYSEVVDDEEASNIVYAATSGAISLADAKFYVMVNDGGINRVYKCLNNANGNPSTSSPSGTNTLPITYSDGYVWKYMYTIQPLDAERYLDDNFIPVRKFSAQQNADNTGLIGNIVLTEKGFGYTSAPNVTITGDGTSATATANFKLDGVLSITVDMAGFGYTSAPDVEISAPDDNTGTLATATATVVDGEVTEFTITNPGTGYTTVPTVTITGGGGTNATATAVLGGIVDSITITNRGDGYSYANIEFSGGGDNVSIEAVAFAYVNSIDNLYNLIDVEDTTTKGTIDRIDIYKSGANYGEDKTTATINGDGTGAVLDVVVSTNTGNIGSIESITITNRGQNYRNATVDITERGPIGDRLGVGAKARAIISPINGHGSNPIDELFAKKLCFYASISEDANTDIFLNNDFRQIGLMKNICKFDREHLPQVYTDLTGAACYILSIPEIEFDGEFFVDDAEITTENGDKFIVVQVSYNGIDYQVFLQPLLNKNGLLENTTTITLYSSLLELELTNVTVTLPEIDVYSGDVIYIDNHTAISRIPNNANVIKTIFHY